MEAAFVCLSKVRPGIRPQCPLNLCNLPSLIWNLSGPHAGLQFHLFQCSLNGKKLFSNPLVGRLIC